MRPDAVRGHVDLLLLSLLDRGPGHGYEVITTLREISGGTLDLPEGSVYPALHRLEDAGLLASDWHPVGGRRRRVYRLTASGRASLATERRSWHDFVGVVERVLTAGTPARALS
jgi:DNA-binding PadR family transcriptional regulator